MHDLQDIVTTRRQKTTSFGALPFKVSQGSIESGEFTLDLGEQCAVGALLVKNMGGNNHDVSLCASQELFFEKLQECEGGHHAVIPCVAEVVLFKFVGGDNRAVCRDIRDSSSLTHSFGVRSVRSRQP